MQMLSPIPRTDFNVTVLDNKKVTTQPILLMKEWGVCVAAPPPHKPPDSPAA